MSLQTYNSSYGDFWSVTVKSFSYQNLTDSVHTTNLSQSNVTQAIIDSSSANILLPPGDYSNFVKAVGYAGEG